ncbi:MAG: hypothetical protein PHC62_00705 [Candidatus Izemoplasmatales bacterium]|nr:hypothetical protein [Candidatus Izemoplasmatales bacterium]
MMVAQNSGSLFGKMLFNTIAGLAIPKAVDTLKNIVNNDRSTTETPIRETQPVIYKPEINFNINFYIVDDQDEVMYKVDNVEDF